MPNPQNLKPFAPGDERINRGGRPAVAKEWREKCQRFMIEDGGFETLMAIAQGKGVPQDQIKALTFIADHAMGKAVQQIAGADEDEFNKLRIIIERSSDTKVTYAGS